MGRSSGHLVWRGGRSCQYARPLLCEHGMGRISSSIEPCTALLCSRAFKHARVDEEGAHARGQHAGLACGHSRVMTACKRGDSHSLASAIKRPTFFVQLHADALINGHGAVFRGAIVREARNAALVNAARWVNGRGKRGLGRGG